MQCLQTRAAGKFCRETTNASLGSIICLRIFSVSAVAALPRFRRPMGSAVANDRMAKPGGREVWCVAGPHPPASYATIARLCNQRWSLEKVLGPDFVVRHVSLEISLILNKSTFHKTLAAT